MPPPPMLDPTAVAGFAERASGRAEEDGDPAKPLSDLLARLADAKPAGEPISFPSPTPVSAHLRSVQMYVQGKSKLLAGDLAGAISDLDTSTRLDPQVAEPWLALAEAQLAQGKRLSAMVSYQQAVRRGTGQSRALWYLGRDALKNGKPRLAAQYLAQARTNDPESSDAALPYLINADLADALIRNGDLRAGGEALEVALELPDQFGSATRLRAELADLYRRRGDLWRDLGDLRSRLGNFDASVRAYAEAEQVPMLDPGSVLPRHVYALMRLGRNAEAGLAVLESVDRAGWYADERAIAVCGYIARRAGLGSAWVDAVDELVAARTLGATPLQSASLERFRAAAGDAERARTILRAVVRSSPTDEGSVGDLIIAVGPSAMSITQEIRALVETFPASAASVADAVIDRADNTDAIIEALSAVPMSDSAALARAALLERTGRWREAAQSVASRAWTGPMKPAGLGMQIRLAMRAGGFGDAEAFFAQLVVAAKETPDGIRAVVSAALDMQRPGAALDAARSLWVQGDNSRSIVVDDCIRAATAALLLDREQDVVDFLRRGIASDRYDERSYEGLFRVYAPPGERPDNEKIGEVARQLRQAVPSARVLRLLTAQEIVQKQDDISAEGLLRGLVEERLSDATAGSALVSIWESRAASARAEAKGGVAAMPESVLRAEAWLREQSARRPEIAWLWTGLGRILTVQGKPEEAERVLAERQALRPWPQFGQMRETILRDWLLKPEEYAAAVRARLEPGPRGIDESLEFAEFLAGQKKTGEAAEVLSSGIPRSSENAETSRVVLTQDQSARFVSILAKAAREWEKKPQVTDAGVSKLFDAASDRKLAFPASLHEFRLRALVNQPAPEPAAVTRALAEACARYPGQSAAFYAAVAASHLQSGRGKDALPFLRSAVASSTNPSADLLFAMVQQTALVGDSQDFDLVIEQLTNPQQITSLLKAMTPDDAPPTEAQALRGQLAYRIGTLYSFMGREELATRAKQIALKFNPGLAWAKNDLGYQILEDGGDFAEAARLIEEAYAALPNEASIIDSIAWVRYHQGVLDDRPATAEQPLVEGAITLLKRAVETAAGKRNGTLHDHLAEALWAAGQRDAAKEAWTRAEALLSDDVNQLKQSASAPAAAIERATKELEGVRAKRRAAAEGNQPSLTPMRSRKQAQLK